MQKKLVIIINGKSGVGKATLVGAAAKELKVRNVSSIDKVKQIAKQAGWDGQKDMPGRQFLSDLKQAMAAYDDSPNKALLQEFDAFAKGTEQVMFVHIREPKEIQKFFVTTQKSDVGTDIKVTSLLVTRKAALNLGLAQDDELAKFKYDSVFNNDKPLEESKQDFIKWLRNQVG